MASLFSRKKKTKRILLVRHGERIDNVFKGLGQDWLNPVRTEEESTRESLKMCNMNIPAKLPKRPDNAAAWVTDSPLTEVGCMQAKIVGKALLEQGHIPNIVYVSPSYRCVQTALHMMQPWTEDIYKEVKGARSKIPASIPVCIEPGLFEWGGFQQIPIRPTWMKPTDMLNPKTVLKEGYTPIIKENDLNMEESLAEYYRRSHIVAQNIVDRSGDAELIMVVGHGPTFEAFSRQLCGKSPRDQQSFQQVTNAIPYLGTLVLKKDSSDRVWSIEDSGILPFEHSSNATYEWTNSRSLLLSRD